ncbi:PLDc N-terminal domain-containing protein [Microbacterium sp. gxy059]|uniref:PLDc N-terminal domain-containing protein n=1 Tax=Microbacterium sp. gxy059 TaxID=2957199 RepID=UPI003D995DA8
MANPLIPSAYDMVASVAVVFVVALAIWALVSVIRSRLDAVATIAWTLLVLLVPVVGSLAWFAVSAGARAARRDERTRSGSASHPDEEPADDAS